VISTQATLDSGEYVHAIREANPGVVVLGRAAPELVDIVEAGDADTARADAALQPIVTDIAAWGADTLVLGCTHYPLLRPSLRRVLGRRRWRIIDSAETTAARVRRILDVNRLGNDGEGIEVRVDTLVTDAPQRFVDTAARLFGDDLPAPRLVDVPSPHMTLAVAR
jgi:glutamate racemase